MGSGHVREYPETGDGNTISVQPGCNESLYAGWRYAARSIKDYRLVLR